MLRARVGAGRGEGVGGSTIRGLMKTNESRL